LPGRAGAGEVPEIRWNHRVSGGIKRGGFKRKQAALPSGEPPPLVRLLGVVLSQIWRLLVGSGEAVAPASFSDDQPWVLKVILELLAEPLDVGFYQSVAVPVLLAPYLVQDGLVG